MRIGNVKFPNTEVFRLELPGLDPGETKIGDEAIEFEIDLINRINEDNPMQILPCAKGKIIKCHYFLEFTSEVEVDQYC